VFETRLRHLKQGFLYTAIACVGLTGLLAIVALLSGNLGGGNDIVQVLVSTLFVALSSSLALACSSGWMKSPTLAIAGTLLAAAAAIASFFPIWSGGDKGFEWKLTTILYLLSTAVAYSLLLAARQRVGARARVKISLAIALVSVACLCATAIELVVTEGDYGIKPMAIAAVLTGTMTPITLILRRLDSIETREPGRKPLIGRRIALIEEGEMGKVLILDDGRRVKVTPDTPLD
jgi:hypothetical protein